MSGFIEESWNLIFACAFMFCYITLGNSTVHLEKTGMERQEHISIIMKIIRTCRPPAGGQSAVPRPAVENYCHFGCSSFFVWICASIWHHFPFTFLAVWSIVMNSFTLCMFGKRIVCFGS